jgi:hypothetical protein
MLKTNAKIQRFRGKKGEGFVLKIVHYFWDSVKQVGTNKLIKTVLYIPAGQDLNDTLFRVYAWNKINRELDALCKEKIVSSADADTAKRKFAELLPKTRTPKPIASGKPDLLAKYRRILNG